MTDTIETAVTPDPHAIARAVLLEVADEPDQVGDFASPMSLKIMSPISFRREHSRIRGMAVVGNAVSR